VVHVKVSKLMAAALVAAAGVAGFGGVARAAPGSSTAAIFCVDGDGVMNLTLTNPATDGDAEFVVTNPATFLVSLINLHPGTSQMVTLSGLPDGSVVVPVQLNGTDVSVTAQISCDPPVCTDGVLSVVTDDSGVQHQACVASAADPAAPARSTLTATAQRTATVGALPTAGSGTGGLLIGAVLVGSGSVVSLLSRRRKPVGGRKGFRRRGANP
jgi:hypothetical protein